ncbi:MAG: PorT family protein [Bacteroidales bacterium]|nr:PorT family protein [Bacteroidales bacterium]
MKKLFFLSLILLLALCIPRTEAQVFRGILIGGFNLSQVDGDEIYGFTKLGANIGAGAMLPFNKKWSVTMETVFSQKGSRQAPIYVDTMPDGTVITGQYSLRLNYVEVPLLIHFTDKEVVSAGAGISYGRLVGVTEKEHGRLVESTTLQNGPYSRDNWEIIGDIKLPLRKNVKINLRYSYSLRKIRTRDFYNIYGEYIKTREQYNNLITVRLIWVFNEKGPTLFEQQAAQ